MISGTSYLHFLFLHNRGDKMNLSLIQVIFAAIPDSFLIVYTGLGLLGIRIKAVTYLKIISCSILSLYIFRNILNIYGFHSIILIVIFILSYRFIVGLDWIISIMAVLLGFILSIIGETICYIVIARYFNIALEGFYQSEGLIFYITYYISKLPLILVLFGIKFFNLKIIDIDFNKNIT